MLKNKYLDSIIQRSITKPSRLILPEQHDIRVKEAAKELRRIGFNVIDIDSFSDNPLYVEHLKNKKFTNNWTDNMISDYLLNPLNKGLLLLDLDQVDCLVAGADTSTSNVIKSTLRIVGLKKDTKWVSSSFFLISPDCDKAFTYSDCGVIPDPDSEQLVSIAYKASEMHRMISGDSPKVAFLSFSTHGSAEHYKVKKVQKAVDIFKNKYPNIINDGEMQFDAAIDREVSNKKISNPILDGNANTFIFPDLNSANIAYKITQYLAGYTAWGPLLQGFNKPVHDLSRGCSVDDIISVSAISAMQSIK